MMPDIAKWDEAMELAVTPEEEAEIRKAQGLGADEEEKRRLQWLKCAHGPAGRARCYGEAGEGAGRCAVVKCHVEVGRGWGAALC